ncbi:MAG: CDC27 family protein [Bacteroidia bacterium]|jgi:antitoxin component YwqK of YwqJK toxin-antitoxin module
MNQPTKPTNGRKFPFVVLLITLFFPIFSGAQEHVSLINTQELMHNAAAAQEEKEYAKALSYYQDVPMGDTNYADASYEIAYCYYRLEKFEDAILQCNRMQYDGNVHMRVYNLQASSLDKLKRYDEAIQVYDNALKKYPYSELLKYNKSLTCERKGDRKSAYAQLQALLLTSPLFPAAHLRLAYYAESEGKLTQAIMAYTVYLMINPDGNNSLSALDGINKLADNSSADVNTATTKVLSNEFEDIDFLVSNQVALNDKFKVPGKMKYPVNKQVYLVFQKTAELQETPEGFFSSFYLPFFRSFLSKYPYDYFSLLMLASSKNENISKEVKKSLKEIVDIRQKTLKEFKQLHPGMEIDFGGKKSFLRFWYNDNSNSVDAFGNTDAAETHREGRWIFLEDDSYISAYGDFDGTGNKTGIWHYFKVGMDTFKVAQYVKGVLDGPYRLYEHGKVSEKGEYKNNEVEGWNYNYFPDGSLQSKEQRSKGERHGDGTIYYANGQPQYIYKFESGKLTGVYKEFYDHGAIKEEGTFKLGKRDGEYKTYNEDGVCNKIATYVNGVLEGPYKTFYASGKPNEDGRAMKGNITGKWTEYYSDGNVYQISFMDENGKNNGAITYFNHKGVKFREDVYTKGEMNTVKYIDSKGKIIYEWKGNKNGSHLAIYDYELNKYGEGLWKENSRQKLWKFYLPNGQLIRTENYLDGLLDGEAHALFENGKTNYKITSKAGEKNGLQLTYFENGNLADEGNFVDGNRYGTWKYYTIEGKPDNESFYWKDSKNAWSLEYLTNGNVYRKYLYNNGLLTRIIQCDTNGVAIDSATLQNGYGKVSMKGLSRKKYYEATYVNSVLHGPFMNMFPDQKVFQKATYFMGYVHGEWIQYWSNGKVQRKRHFFHGDKTGTWEYYNYFGELISKVEYKYANNHGTNTWYYPDGKVTSQIGIYMGDFHGPVRYFAPDGQVRVVNYYEFGKLLGYSYMGKNGKMVDTVFLNNGEGKVTAYYANGKVSTEFEVKARKYHGAYKIYYPDGKLQEERFYEYGNEISPTRTYYPDGKPWHVTGMLFGNYSGEELIYNPNGTLRMRQMYANNQLDGLCQYFDTNGKLMQSVVYNKGEPVSIK